MINQFNGTHNYAFSFVLLYYIWMLYRYCKWILPCRYLMLILRPQLLFLSIVSVKFQSWNCQRSGRFPPNETIAIRTGKMEFRSRSAFLLISHRWAFCSHREVYYETHYYWKARSSSSTRLYTVVYVCSCVFVNF